MSKILPKVASASAVVGLLAALISSIGCNAANPTAPTVPACQTNNTARVTFENRSGTGKVYAVVWDGSTVETLGAGVKGEAHTVTAGIPHSLLFKVANSSRHACNISWPNLAQCSSHTFWCTY
ncbi:MAG: hypothetical protein PVJ73_16790 [Acidobacteriota bacterium]|jgi:hypothetical protein